MMRCSRRQVLVSFALVLVAYVWCAAQYDDITLAVHLAAVHLAASLALGSAAHRLPRYLVVFMYAALAASFGYLLFNLISPADEIGPIYKSGMGKYKRGKDRSTRAAWATDLAKEVAAFLTAAALLGFTIDLDPSNKRKRPESEADQPTRKWCRGCMLPVYLKANPEIEKRLANAASAVELRKELGKVSVSMGHFITERTKGDLPCRGNFEGWTQTDKSCHQSRAGFPFEYGDSKTGTIKYNSNSSRRGWDLDGDDVSAAASSAGPSSDCGGGGEKKKRKKANVVMWCRGCTFPSFLASHPDVRATIFAAADAHARKVALKKASTEMGKWVKMHREKAVECDMRGWTQGNRSCHASRSFELESPSGGAPFTIKYCSASHADCRRWCVTGDEGACGCKPSKRRRGGGEPESGEEEEEGDTRGDLDNSSSTGLVYDRRRHPCRGERFNVRHLDDDPDNPSNLDMCAETRRALGGVSDAVRSPIGAQVPAGPAANPAAPGGEAAAAGPSSREGNVASSEEEAPAATSADDDDLEEEERSEAEPSSGEPEEGPVWSMVEEIAWEMHQFASQDLTEMQVVEEMQRALSTPPPFPRAAADDVDNGYEEAGPSSAVAASSEGTEHAPESLQDMDVTELVDICNETEAGGD